MISPHCFSFKWIDEKRRELGCDPAILEKSVHALDLLALLAENGPYFVFKGGTSLLLRLPTIRRLSIDIDMVCQDFDAIKSTLDKFCKPEARFFRWEHDLRRDRENPPLRHIKVYYKPVAGAGKFDEYVLLDILTSPPSYPKIELLPISIPSLDIGADHQVNVAMPSVEGLLADKLAAFAPTTIGILYSKGEVLQIAKQLFDVGELFEMEHELKNIRTAYKAIFAEENRYRGGRHTFESCLKDTIEAGMKLSRMELKGAPPEDEEAKALRKGINNLSGNLV